MFENISQHFHKLFDDEPGERFQQQFSRRHKDRKYPLLNKLIFIGGGVIVIAGGIIMLPLPGSGTVIIIIGLGLVAQESLRISRFLDWLEVEIRKVTDPLIEWWEKQASIPMKIVVSIFILIFLLA